MMKRIKTMFVCAVCALFCLQMVAYADRVEEMLSGMTLNEKVGQMLILDLPNVGKDASTAMNDVVKLLIDRYKPGGVILFAKNILSPKQVTALISDMQSRSDVPLFLALDEEGGVVSRLYPNKGMPGKKMPTAASVGKTGDPKNAYNNMTTLSVLLKKLGFNLDFAPVADVNTNPKNPVIGSRAYGTNPDKTAPFVVNAIDGLQENGVLACAKHFPGLGDSGTDPHDNLTVIDHDLTRLSDVEFVTFRAAIGANVAMIMTGHINTPNITTDGLPATMSPVILTDILRGQLKFDGIIITDALNMGAITKLYAPDDTAIKAVKAGVDILLMPANAENAYDALLNAVHSGDITEARVDESVRRILEAKMRYGIIQ